MISAFYRKSRAVRYKSILTVLRGSESPLTATDIVRRGACPAGSVYYRLMQMEEDKLIKSTKVDVFTANRGYRHGGTTLSRDVYEITKKGIVYLATPIR